MVQGKPQSILVIRQDNFGDVISTFPLTGCLKDLFPHATITFMAKAIYVPLVRTVEAVDRAIAYTPDCQLDDRYDLVFVVYPRPKLAFRLWKQRRKARIRIGSGYRWYSFLFNKRVYQHRKESVHHEAYYTLSMIYALKDWLPEPRWPSSEYLYQWIQERRPRLRLPTITPKVQAILEKARGRSLIIVHPFKSPSSLNWSPDRYQSLIDRLLSGNRSFFLVCTASQKESCALHSLLSRWKDRWGVDLLPVSDLSILELAMLYSRADLWMGGSTGPMHLASYLGIPTVALFGKSRAFRSARWGPLYSRGVALEADVPPCQTCIYARCPFFNCVDRIAVEKVFTAMIDLLNKRKH